MGVEMPNLVFGIVLNIYTINSSAAASESSEGFVKENLFNLLSNYT